MFKVTRLIHLASGVDQSRVEALRGQLSAALTGAQRSVVEPTLPGSRNGGDLLVHAQFDSERSWDLSRPALEGVLADIRIVHVDGVDYQTDCTAAGSPGTVYRTLLLAVEPQTPAPVAAQFESDLLLMPRYVSTITAFALSRPTRTYGASRWTHVFEQEFTDEAGIMGAYLMHPIHWAVVDRWFDPECPEFIIRARVCHSYCAIDEPVLAVGNTSA